MAASASIKSYDTTELTTRTIYAFDQINAAIPSSFSLLTAPYGQSYWGVRSTFAQNYGFNRISTNVGVFTADASSNQFTLTEGLNIGFSPGNINDSLYIYTKGFNEVDVSGGDSFTSLNNPRINIAATGAVNLRSDPYKNILFIDGQVQPLQGTAGTLQNIKVISNIAYPQDYYVFNASNASSAINFVGLGDVSLYADSNTNSIYYTINQSTFTAATYLGYYSSLSTTYTQIPDFSTAVTIVSSQSYSDLVTGTSLAIGLASNLSTTLVQRTNFSAYVTGIQFNYTNNISTGIIQAGISSLSTSKVPLPVFLSTTNSLINVISTFHYVSTFSSGILYGGIVSTIKASNVFYFGTNPSSISTSLNSTLLLLSSQINQFTSSVNTFKQLLSTSPSSFYSSFATTVTTNLTSTSAGLGTAGYVSTITGITLVTSQQLTSSVIGLGTEGYLSTATLYSTFGGLANLGYVTQSSFVAGFNSVSTNYVISKAFYQGFSSINAAGYIRDFSTNSFSTNNLIVSSVNLTDPFLPSSNESLVLSNGSIYFNGAPLSASGSVYFSTSIYSTITYTGRTRIQSQPIGQTGSFLFSTLSFNLAPLSSFIVSSTSICVDFNYYLNFDFWKYKSTTGFTNNHANPVNMFTFSTGVIYNTTPDFANISRTTVSAKQTYYYLNTYLAFQQQNIVAVQNKIQLNTKQLMVSYPTISLFHFCDTAAYYDINSTTYVSGLNTSTVNTRYSPNALLINLFN
jgi:hypothetical protein